jgi:hypothetical protein
VNWNRNSIFILITLLEVLQQANLRTASFEKSSLFLRPHDRTNRFSVRKELKILFTLFPRAFLVSGINPEMRLETRLRPKRATDTVLLALKPLPKFCTVARVCHDLNSDTRLTAGMKRVLIENPYIKLLTMNFPRQLELLVEYSILSPLYALLLTSSP